VKNFSVKFFVFKKIQRRKNFWKMLVFKLKMLRKLQFLLKKWKIVDIFVENPYTKEKTSSAGEKFFKQMLVFKLKMFKKLLFMLKKLVILVKK